VQARSRVHHCAWCHTSRGSSWLCSSPSIPLPRPPRRPARLSHSTSSCRGGFGGTEAAHSVCRSCEVRCRGSTLVNLEKLRSRDCWGDGVSGGDQAMPFYTPVLPSPAAVRLHLHPELWASHGARIGVPRRAQTVSCIT
jgi:hypothetical protein